MKTWQLFTLIFICTIFSCQNNKKEDTSKSEKDCIDNVLAKDSELGKLRNHECETITLQKTIDNYTKAMQNLNFDDCPKKFGFAFKNHIVAWDIMGKFTKKHSSLRGEMHDLFDSIEKTQDSSSFKPLLKNIWDTWAEVEAAQPQKK